MSKLYVPETRQFCMQEQNVVASPFWIAFACKDVARCLGVIMAPP